MSAAAPHTETAPARSRKSLLLLILLAAAATGTGVWANLWKENLRVQDVSVRGNSIVSEHEILALAGIAKGEKLFAINLFAVQKRVMKNRFLRAASVNREVPGRISITVEERVPVAAVVADRVLYLDADGYVLPPAVSEQTFDLPVVSGSLSSLACVPGRQITNAAVREGVRILALAQKLDDDLYRRISEVRIDTGRDIIAYTAEFGVPVLFGHGDVGAKLVKFNAFWRQFVATYGAHELAYVDLRFADQVVVRWNHEGDKRESTGEVPRVDVQHKRSVLLLPTAAMR